jgi:hypothetical protein
MLVGRSKPAEAAKFPFPELLKRMRWGDVILFECHMAHSVAQRWVTWSPWDHVAVVVEDSDGRLQMLESCALGVRAWPLAQRLREYATHFATRIAWRQLRTPRSDHALRAMRRFVDAVDQQAVFSYNLAKMTLTPREGWFWEATASGGKGTRLGGSSAARDVSRTTSTTRTAFSHPVYSLDLRPKTAPQRRADGRVELVRGVELVRTSECVSEGGPLSSGADGGGANDGGGGGDAGGGGDSSGDGSGGGGVRLLTRQQQQQQQQQEEEEEAREEELPLEPRPARPPASLTVEKDYFCSELTCGLLHNCGLLAAAARPASFWPRDFRDGGSVEGWMAEGVELDAPVLLDLERLWG